MVRADLEGLVSPHHQARLAVLLVLQESHVAGSALLPLLGLAVESEQLGAHLEGLLLELLVGLDVDLLGQADNGLEVDIGFGLNVLSDGSSLAGPFKHDIRSKCHCAIAEVTSKQAK